MSAVGHKSQIPVEVDRNLEGSFGMKWEMSLHVYCSSRHHYGGDFPSRMAFSLEYGLMGVSEEGMHACT